MNIVTVFVLSALFLFIGLVFGSLYPILARSGDSEKSKDNKSESVNFVLKVFKREFNIKLPFITRTMDEKSNDVNYHVNIAKREYVIKFPAIFPKNPPPKDNMSEIASFWRDKKEQETFFQIDTRLIKVGEKLNFKEKNRITNIIKKLQEWPDIVGVLKVEEVEEEPASPLVTTAELQDQPIQTEEKLSFDPLRPIKRAVQTDAIVETPPMNLAEEIDDILQKLLIASPLKKKGIRLMDFPGRGMVFMIGMDMYDTIEDVPDNNIQKIIREAVAAWENKSEDDKK